MTMNNLDKLLRYQELSKTYFILKKSCYINVGRRGEKISHLSNRNEKRKWSKTNLFANLCSYKSAMRVTMTGNNNVYKTIWKSGNEKYNDKYICYFFTMWNLKSRVTDKRGQVVLSRTSLYFAISNLIVPVNYFDNFIW